MNEISSTYENLHSLVEGASAYQMVTYLQADSAGSVRPDGTIEGSIVNPTIYARSEKNGEKGDGKDKKDKDKVSDPLVAILDRGKQHGNVEKRVVLHSVAAEAHRMKEILRRRLEDGSLDVPLPRVRVQGTAVMNDGEIVPYEVDILQMPHGPTDAYLRETKEWDDFNPMYLPIGQYDTRDNMTYVYSRAPQAMVFGAWNSFAQALARFPRILTANIDGIAFVSRELVSFQNNAKADANMKIEEQLRGIDVPVMAVRVDPLIKSSEGISATPPSKSSKGSANSKKATVQANLLESVEQKNLFDTDDDEESDDENPKTTKSEKKAKRIAEIGLGMIPDSSGTTRRVAIDYAIAKAVCNFVGLRRYGFPDPQNKKRDCARDRAGQCVAASLAMLMYEMAHADGYDLKSGCNLIPIKPPERVVIDSDGARSAWKWNGNPLQSAVALYRESVAKAAEFGLVYDDDWTLHASDRLNTVVAKSKQNEIKDEKN